MMRHITFDNVALMVKVNGFVKAVLPFRILLRKGAKVFQTKFGEARQIQKTRVRRNYVGALAGKRNIGASDRFVQKGGGVVKGVVTAFRPAENALGLIFDLRFARAEFLLSDQASDRRMQKQPRKHILKRRSAPRKEGISVKGGAFSAKREVAFRIHPAFNGKIISKARFRSEQIVPAAQSVFLGIAHDGKALFPSVIKDGKIRLPQKSVRAGLKGKIVCFARKGGDHAQATKKIGAVHRRNHLGRHHL